MSSRLTGRLQEALALVNQASLPDHSHRIGRIRDDLLCEKKERREWVGVLRWVERGTKDLPRNVRAVDLAVANCEAWISQALPGSSSDSERGGSSSPMEVDDGREAGRVSRQAVRDLPRFDALTRSILVSARLLGRKSGDELAAVLVELEGDCRGLGQMVARYVVPVDHSKLPPNDPRCVSCERVDEFDDVWDKAKSTALCRWCWDHREKGARLPPLEAVRIRWERGKRAAGVWFARQKVNA